MCNPWAWTNPPGVHRATATATRLIVQRATLTIDPCSTRLRTSKRNERAKFAAVRIAKGFDMATTKVRRLDHAASTRREGCSSQLLNQYIRHHTNMATISIGERMNPHQTMMERTASSSASYVSFSRQNRASSMSFFTSSRTANSSTPTFLSVVRTLPARSREWGARPP